MPQGFPIEGANENPVSVKLDQTTPGTTNAVAPFLKTGDSTYQVPRMDVQTHVLSTITYEHHEIHAGSSFTAHFNNDVTNIGEMTVIAFNTPNTTKWAHLTITGFSSGFAYLALYENPSIDVDEGSALAVFNRDRNSSVVSTLTSIETTPVANRLTSYTEAQAAGANITTDTELARTYIGAGTRQTVGGTDRSTEEWILDQNQQYAIVMYSLTADDATHNITLNWYEHTNRTA